MFILPLNLQRSAQASVQMNEVNDQARAHADSDTHNGQSTDVQSNRSKSITAAQYKASRRGHVKPRARAKTRSTFAREANHAYDTWKALNREGTNDRARPQQWRISWTLYLLLLVSSVIFGGALYFLSPIVSLSCATLGANATSNVFLAHYQTNVPDLAPMGLPSTLIQQSCEALTNGGGAGVGVGLSLAGWRVAGWGGDEQSMSPAVLSASCKLGALLAHSVSFGAFFINIIDST